MNSFVIKLTRRRLRRLIHHPSKSPKYFTRKRRRKLSKGRFARTLPPSEQLVNISIERDAATGFDILVQHFKDGSIHRGITYGVAIGDHRTKLLIHNES